MRTIFLPLLFVTASCGGNDEAPLTWGSASLQVGGAYCATIGECGYPLKNNCPDHIRWHLCEPNNSCDVELPGEAQVAVDECVDALGPSDENCALLVYGWAPPKCDPFFALDPGPQSDAQ